MLFFVKLQNSGSWLQQILIKTDQKLKHSTNFTKIKGLQTYSSFIFTIELSFISSKMKQPFYLELDYMIAA